MSLETVSNVATPKLHSVRYYFLFGSLSGLLIIFSAHHGFRILRLVDPSSTRPTMNTCGLNVHKCIYHDATIYDPVRRVAVTITPSIRQYCDVVVTFVPPVLTHLEGVVLVVGVFDRMRAELRRPGRACPSGGPAWFGPKSFGKGSAYCRIHH